jgi:hypothetical protein
MVHAFSNAGADRGRALFIAAPGSLQTMIEDFCEAFLPGEDRPMRTSSQPSLENTTSSSPVRLPIGALFAPAQAWDRIKHLSMLYGPVQRERPR